MTLKSKLNNSRGVRFLKRHVIIILIIAIGFAAAACFVLWYNQTVDAQVTQQSAATKQFIKEADEKIQDIKEEQAAIEKAKKEAAEKLAAEKAAAKAAAEKAAATAPGGSIGGAAGNVAICGANGGPHSNPASIDVVINKKHCFNPYNYVPGDLVTSHGATISAKAVADFNKMYDAAAAAGQPFRVTSSYRSYNTQVATYNHWVATSGRAGADTYSARPGYSEHQTGFVIDVAAGSCSLSCFGGTSQYGWFKANAATYGFIQRYHAGYTAITGYTSEEWHYRYVGVAVAKDMQAKGIKTLEQYWGVSGGDYE